MARRYFSSVAVATTITGNISASATTVSVNSLTGYPASTPWTALLDPDTAAEEIVTVTNVSGTTLTIVRGVDGSTGVAHSAGAVLRHAVTARDFDELNEYITNKGNALAALPSQFFV